MSGAGALALRADLRLRRRGGSSPDVPVVRAHAHRRTDIERRLAAPARLSLTLRHQRDPERTAAKPPIPAHDAKRAGLRRR